MMRIGAMTHTLTVQRRSDAIGEGGETVVTWSDLAKLRAELVEASTGEDLREGGGAVSQGRAKLRVRFLTGLTLDDRVMWRGRAWNIKAAVEIGRRYGLELDIEAGP